MRHVDPLLGATFALALVSCGDTGRDYVELPLYAQGTDARPVSVPSGTLTLSQADVLVGPLYLCATESAESALCETALAEHLELISVDALDASSAPVGELSATTGTVRSAFFDYGLSWLLTKPGPAFPDSAPFRNSARLRFSARALDGSELDVRADIDIAPLAAGDAAVNGRKTEQRIGKAPLSLTLQLDANAWLARVRIEELVALDEDGDGRVTLRPDSQPYEAILQGMTARNPLAFVWR
jgi:hypothetical protein